MKLITKRLTLRKPSLNDAKDLAENGNEKSMFYFTWYIPYPFTIAKAKKIIKKAKYKFFYDTLGELINLPDGEEYFYLRKFLESGSVVVPVPLHEKRYRERGFNQADVIGQAFAAWHKLAFDGHLLLRTRDTGHQAGRSRAERLLALENSIKIANWKLKIPQAVLLVDDVWTTGATMSECCRVLKTAGVKKVWGMVLAR